MLLRTILLLLFASFSNCIIKFPDAPIYSRCVLLVNDLISVYGTTSNPTNYEYCLRNQYSIIISHTLKGSLANLAVTVCDHFNISSDKNRMRCISDIHTDMSLGRRELVSMVMENLVTSVAYEDEHELNNAVEKADLFELMNKRVHNMVPLINQYPLNNIRNVTTFGCFSLVQYVYFRLFTDVSIQYHVAGEFACLTSIESLHPLYDPFLSNVLKLLEKDRSFRLSIVTVIKAFDILGNYHLIVNIADSQLYIVHDDSPVSLTRGDDGLTHNDDYFREILDVLSSILGVRLLLNRSGMTVASPGIDAPKVIWEHLMLNEYDHTLKHPHHMVTRSKVDASTLSENNSIGILPMKSKLHIYNGLLHCQLLLNWTSSIVHAGGTNSISVDGVEENEHVGGGNMQVYIGNMWISEVKSVESKVLASYGINVEVVINPIPYKSSIYYSSYYTNGAASYDTLRMFTRNSDNFDRVWEQACSDVTANDGGFALPAAYYDQVVIITLTGSAYVEFATRLRTQLHCIGYKYVFIVPDVSVELIMAELVPYLSDAGELSRSTHLDGTTSQDDLSGFHLLQIIINPAIDGILTLFPHYVVVLLPMEAAKSRVWDVSTQSLLKNAIGIWYADSFDQQLMLDLKLEESLTTMGLYHNDEVYIDIKSQWENTRPTSYNIQLRDIGMPIDMLATSMRSIVLSLVSELFCKPFKESAGEHIHVHNITVFGIVFLDGLSFNPFAHSFTNMAAQFCENLYAEFSPLLYHAIASRIRDGDPFYRSLHKAYGGVKSVILAECQADVSTLLRERIDGVGMRLDAYIASSSSGENHDADTYSTLDTLLSRDLHSFSTTRDLAQNGISDRNANRLSKLKNELYFPGHPKVAFITAIYGGYELSCKKYATQSIPTDFICFTDNHTIQSNGWIVDTKAYHITKPSRVDTRNFTNSMGVNMHSFNIAKYYKQQFYLIPRLVDYDVVVWIDGSVEITDSDASLKLYVLLSDSANGGGHVVAFNQTALTSISTSIEARFSLSSEVHHSENYFRYCATYWNNQIQPYQNVSLQYAEYLRDGYVDNGLWYTTLVGFRMKNHQAYNQKSSSKNAEDNIQMNMFTKELLDMWYLQTLRYTTQDQVGFMYVLYKMIYSRDMNSRGLFVTLPNDLIRGKYAFQQTDLYIKRKHGI